MTNHLNYPGDCTPTDPDHTYGPDMYGAHYRATAAEYNGTRTRITLQPIPPSALGHYKQRMMQWIQDAGRLKQLFGGNP